MPQSGAENGRRVDARAEKRFFISMLVKDIELIPAITDLVDNSVDGAGRLKPDRDFEGLTIEIEATGDRFSMVDNCGGIPIDLARDYAFRFGRPEDYEGEPNSIGQFGVGLKRALFKLGSAFEIESKTATSRFTLPVDVNEWAADLSEDWTFEFGVADEEYNLQDGEEAGTSIVVTNLHESVAQDFRRTSVIATLRADLRLRHQEALQAGLQITVNGDRLNARRPALVASGEVGPIRKSFSLNQNGDEVRVELYAGIVRGGDDDRDEGEAEDFPLDSEAERRTGHTPASIARFAETLQGEREPTSRFLRLRADGLCSTIRAGTGYERGSFMAPRPIHPISDRVISVREAARLHSFPDWFRFHVTKWHGFRQIGNALPPLLGRAIAVQLAQALEVTPAAPDFELDLGDMDLLRRGTAKTAERLGTDLKGLPSHGLRTRKGQRNGSDGRIAA